MSELSGAEQLNEKGMRLRDEGDIVRAEEAYRAAMSLDPDWSAPVYNLGLLCKYEGRWTESFDFNSRAAELAPNDQASWWNLGIAATALGNWLEARRAWAACGLTPPAGHGPPDFGWGVTPVRLNPEWDGEVVWARRIDPARAQIVSIPLPTSRFQWRDVVLIDGAVEGERIVGQRKYPVFNVLQRLVRSAHRKYVIELISVDSNLFAALEKCAEDRDAAIENWGVSTRILCHECSRGLPHEHTDDDGAPAHPHCGLAARDRDHADAIITAWLAENPRADVVSWYEAPEN